MFTRWYRSSLLLLVLCVGFSLPAFAQSLSHWEQANPSGFGDPLTVEVSALEPFDGYLYAGSTNLTAGARVYRSADGLKWDSVSQPGFGVPHDTAPRAIVDLAVFGGRIYASTGRGDGAAHLWRSSNGATWTPMTVTGFGDPDTKDVTVLAVFDGMLYAGAANKNTGAQIWRSPSGDNNTWTQVAPTNPGSGPAAVTAFATFGGALYATVESNGPVEVWRSATGSQWEPVVSDGFGDSGVTSSGGMAEFGGYLYVGAGHQMAGAQLWRTNDGAAWDQVLTPGFADANNRQIDSVFTFQNQLYVSTRNAATGLEVWRSADGQAWEQTNADGFGDSHNTASNWANATAGFLGRLYIGTANTVDGGELWRQQAAQPRRTFLPLVALSSPAPTSALARPAPASRPVTAHLVIENVGQYPEPARFMLQQGDRRIWLTRDAIWLTVPDPAAAPPTGKADPDAATRRHGRIRRPSAGSRPGVALRFTFAGADLTHPEGFGPVDTHVCYLIGRDPAAWRTDAPVWSGVRYHDIYPGIDLVVGDSATGLIPWRLDAQPGADLRAVKVLAEGADTMTTEADRLRLQIGQRSVEVALPDSQSAAAPAGPPPGDLLYNVTIGGSAYDSGYASAVDAAGNMYVTGETESTNFPVSPGVIDPTNGGATELNEAFVAKYSADGSQLLFATYLGGSAADIGWGIAVSGELPYVIGETASNDFPGMSGTVQGTDMFVAALTADGKGLRYVTRLGGSGEDIGYALAVENSNVFLTGLTKSGDLAGTNCAGATDGDMVVARLGSIGLPVFTWCFGGTDFDAGYAIAARQGAAFATGESWSPDWLLSGPAQGGDIMVVRIEADGAWGDATLAGVTGDEVGNGIAVDWDGNAYIAGTTNSASFPVTAGTPAYGGGDSDAFVLKLDTAFAFDFATFLGGDGEDTAAALAVDTARGLYVAGSTASTNFPATVGSRASGRDGFVARLHLASTARTDKVTYATYLGGANDDWATGIATDTGGNAFVSGSYAAAETRDSYVAFAAKVKVSSPPAAPAVTIATSGSNVRLSWLTVSGAAKYQVFRSSAPYFKPNEWGSLLTLAEQTATSYTDSNALTQVNACYYVVKSLSAAPEHASVNSKRVGKFTFQLVKGN